MVLRVIVSLFFVFGIFGIFHGCTKSVGAKKRNGHEIVLHYQEGEPLAKVGEVTLSLEELSRDFVDRQGIFAGKPDLNSEKKRKSFVENQVVQEAIFQEALKSGYLSLPEVKRDIKKIVVQKMMRDKLEHTQETYIPTKQEMKKHYDENLNLYKRGEAVKVIFVTIPYNNNKASAKKFATALQEDLKNNVKKGNTKQFARRVMKLAQSYLSGSGTMVEANETSYLEKAAFENKFGSAHFDRVKSLDKIGEVAPLAQTKNSYHVMMKKGYRKPLNESLDQAQEKIKKRLAFQNRGNFYQEYINSLRKKYNIRIYEDKVADLGKNVIEGIKKKGNVASRGD